MRNMTASSLRCRSGQSPSSSHEVSVMRKRSSCSIVPFECQKIMKKNNCPKCYNELQVRSTTPCYVCGCYHSEEEIAKKIEKDNFTLYGLPNNTELVLCQLCYLEDVLDGQGDLLTSLKIKQTEAHASVRFLDHSKAEINKDKYCTTCNKRLSLLKLIRENED